MRQAVRFDVGHPDLCPALRWRGHLVPTAEDPAVPGTRDTHYWCVFTQTCVGPDGQLAEPHPCSAPARPCHRRTLEDLRGGAARKGEDASSGAARTGAGRGERG